MRVDAWGDAVATVTLRGCEQENKKYGAFLLPNKRPCDCPLTAVMLSQLRPPPPPQHRVLMNFSQLSHGPRAGVMTYCEQRKDS